MLINLWEMVIRLRGRVSLEGLNVNPSLAACLEASKTEAGSEWSAAASVSCKEPRARAES